VVKPKISLRLESFHNLAVHGDPSENKTQAAGEFNRWSALGIAKTRDICPDFLDGLSEPLDDSFECVV